jgi:competence protein ComEC
LFTGDIEAEAEAQLVETLETVDVIKVPHHGSTSSSSEALVAATQAKWAVISCGERNRFRHPRPRTLHRWRDASVIRYVQDPVSMPMWFAPGHRGWGSVHVAHHSAT